MDSKHTPVLYEQVGAERPQTWWRTRRFLCAGAVGVLLVMTAVLEVGRSPTSTSGSPQLGTVPHTAATFMGGGLRAQTSVPHTAATFMGGGFRAQTSYTAFLAGMMGATGLELEELMRAFPTISSNSGGTWFLTSLIFSSSYNDMMARMAADPAQAAAIFNNSWVKPLLSLQPLGSANIPNSTYTTLAMCAYMLMFDLAALQKIPIAKVGKKGAQEAWKIYLGSLGPVQKASAKAQLAVAEKTCHAMPKTCEKRAKDKLKEHLPPPSDILSELAQMAKATGIPFLQDFILWLGFMQTGGDSWEQMVAGVLKKTAGISLDVTLGSSPMNWANGKLWHACTSIPTPQMGDSSDGIGHNVWAVQEPLAVLSKFIRYNVSTLDASIKNNFGIYTPGKFSYVLGSGQSKLALPICGEESCFGFRRIYSGTTKDDHFTATSPNLGALFETAFTDSGHSLPVSRIAASSSAAEGGTNLFEISAGMMSGQCYDLATWISGAPDGKSYEVATKVKHDAFKAGVTQSTVDKLASSGVGAFIDGGYTDNLGLAWAISSGARTATVLMDGLGVNAVENFFQLFGAPQNGVCPMCFLSFDIFTMSYQDAEKEWSTFPSLEVPSSSHYLKAITYGTIQTTTKANKWFNISAGVPITLKLILVNATDVHDALFTNYYAYADFVGEIMTTLTNPSNKPAVYDILEDYFMQRPAEQ